MNNKIKDMGDLLQIKNEIDSKLPNFNTYDVLISLTKNCKANQLQYSFEKEYYNYEQMYLKRCEIEINKTPLGRNNYSELMESFEYELIDTRNKVQEIMETYEWSELVELTQQREDLERKIDCIDISDKPENFSTKAEYNETGLFFAGAVAVIGLVIVGCVVADGSENGKAGEALQAMTCFIVPIVIAVIYFVISLSSSAKHNQINKNYETKLNQKKALENDRCNIMSQISNVVYKIKKLSDL